MLFTSIVGKRFEKKEEISLDGIHFVRCYFDHSHFLYSGGPFLMEDCILHNCELTTQGAAAIVLESLTRIGFQISPPVGQLSVSDLVH